MSEEDQDDERCEDCHGQYQHGPLVDYHGEKLCKRCADYQEKLFWSDHQEQEKWRRRNQ